MQPNTRQPNTRCTIIRQPITGSTFIRRIMAVLVSVGGLPLLVILLILSAGSTPATAQCAHGDPDGSGSVDINDYALFLECQAGGDGDAVGGGSLQPGCGSVDLDTDGDVDLQDFARFQSIFGVEHGPLFPTREYDVGNAPVSVAIGDLDGDGDIDFAVVNGGSDNISVLLNKGDGTYTDDVTYVAGEDPRSVAVDDLDGDGDIDLVAANGFNNFVTVLLSGCIP